jgi:hypothetical protein
MRDFIISILLLAGTITLYISFRWMEEPRAVVFPKVVVGIMIVLSALLFIQTLIIKKKAAAQAGRPFSFGPAIVTFVLTVIYFALMERLGFYLSSFLFFVAVTFILGREDLTFRKGTLRVGLSVCFMIILYILFNKLLAVQTPKGLLF